MDTELLEGDSIPELTLMRMTADGPVPVSTTELLSGKKVVLFALPGAFTPTCSAQHLPGFVNNADAIKAKGVDIIACLSVNDAFVMDAWGKAQGVGDKVLMLADGNAEFTKHFELDMDASGFGMGIRSQRYSMIIEDRVVKKLNIEDGKGLDVSSAEKILEQL
jgi:peroxiredoxin